MHLNDIHSIYFVGIGGIGMSALARYFNSRGADVHGYDKTETELTRKLAAEGMKIHYTDDVAFIPEKVDLVVYTPAIPKDHQELNYFKNNGFDLKKRSEVLGIISRGMKNFGVAGTHGKTTTSSILTYLLRTGGIDCTAFLGGIARNFESNYIEGKGEWVVEEADEFDRSFLQLNPDVAIILSMDADHLDIYGDESSVLESYHLFAKRVKPGGHLIHRNGLPVALDEDYRSQVKVETFGIEQGTYVASNIRVIDGWFYYDFDSPALQMKDIRFALPGRHNIENATAATAAALQAGIGEAAIREAMATFKGVKRRFDFIVRTPERVYIDDYAHHPTELKSAIQAARMLYPGRKITGIFQPHLFSRTRDFAAGFAEALDGLDEVFLLEIYPARELPIPGVDAGIIFDKMNITVKTRLRKEELLASLDPASIDVLLTLGAGDIDTMVQPIKELLES